MDLDTVPRRAWERALMLVIGHDEAVTRWVGARLRIEDFGPSRAIGVMRGSEMMAGAVFHNWQPRHRSIEISFASATPRWATRDAIRGIMAYAFVQLGCNRLTAISEAGNRSARAFMLRLGFTIEGFHPEALATGDAISFGMLRRDCKWLEG